MAGLMITLPHPSERQKLFLSDHHKYVAFGGARGGGKSFAVRFKAIIMAFSRPGIAQMIIRRSYPELDANHIRPMLALLPVGSYRYNDSKKLLRFPNGSTILFRYCSGDGDLLNYQGTECDILYIDEATQFSEYQFRVLAACVRGANSFPKRVYITCNPGGIGHTWVKRLFIDRDFLSRENPDEYSFIQSLVTDNKALMESDPDYVAQLEALPDRLKQAWLYGSWEIVDGLYFDEYRYDLHTIPDRDLTGETYRYYTSMDYGLDMLAYYVYACDTRGNVLVIRELYESGVLVSDAAEKIKVIESGLHITARYAPPDLWNTSAQTGKSIVDGFVSAGIGLVKTDNHRHAGSLYIKEMLKSRPTEDGGERPKLQIFRSCRNLIRCLSQIMVDDKDPTVYAVEPHELTHSVDSLRYFCVQWWQAARAPKPVEPDRPKWSESMREDYRKASPAEKRYLRRKWGNPN